jgi:hypothetical protein
VESALHRDQIELDVATSGHHRGPAGRHHEVPPSRNALLGPQQR